MAKSNTRLPGDHGTALQAIEWALQHSDTYAVDFLESWRVGDLAGWPEYYNWLDAQRRPVRFAIRPIIAWFDCWIGAYWNRDSRTLYLFPVPMFGIAVQLPHGGR